MFGFSLLDVISILFALVVAYLVYIQWRQESAAGLRDMVRRLVAAAEQLFDVPSSGKEKFAWVMARLVKRYPLVDWDILEEQIQEAVYELNNGKGRDRGH